MEIRSWFLEFCQQSCSGILAELQAGDSIVIEPRNTQNCIDHIDTRQRHE